MVVGSSVRNIDILRETGYNFGRVTRKKALTAVENIALNRKLGKNVTES
jgi:hypothetical protein